MLQDYFDLLKKLFFNPLDTSLNDLLNLTAMTLILLVIELIASLYLLYISFILVKLLIRTCSSFQLPELREALPGGEGEPLLIGFFHPYCNSGGGGERVLWEAVKAIQNKYSMARCIIYTGDSDIDRDTIINKIKQCFNIELLRKDEKSLTFVYLKYCWLVESKYYPHFTLIGQSIGSMLLGFEALLRFVPAIYIDTTGYAFTLPIFKYLCNSKTACYVHYPTISLDMLELVSNRVDTYNNAGFIARSSLLSLVKLFYYKLFAWFYSLAGNSADLVMVNSTWTYNHIRSIWNRKVISIENILYPPCNVNEFLTVPLTMKSERNQLEEDNDWISIDNKTEDHYNENNKHFTILSVGQYRPEKNHRLQLKAFKLFLEKLSEVDIKKKLNNINMVIVGGCRNTEDQRRVDDLINLANELKIEKFVEFKTNVPFDQLKELITNASVGIHTMWNEHFGIVLVESMAAGLLMLSNNSGGPKMDILTNFEEKPTGFLADDEDSYANALYKIYHMNNRDQFDIRANARKSVLRFSDECFDENFIKLFKRLID